MPDAIAVPDAEFLVVGCGSIGKRHLRNLKQLGANRLVAFDPVPERRREVEEGLGIRTVADLPAAMGQFSGMGVALVCSPTRLHLEHSLLAASAGRHLFVEKPVAETAEGLDALLNTIKEKRLASLVGCNFRFHPGLRHVRGLVQSGALGRIVSARAQFGQYLPDWHPWEDYRQGYSARRSGGGGVCLDRIHELDYIRWLLGEVKQVFAYMDHLSHLEIDTEDTVEVLLRFESGAIGSVHLDYVRRSYDCSLEIVGDLGTLQWRFQDHSVSWEIAGEGCRQSRAWPKYDVNQMYLDEMRHFFGVLLGEETSELDAEDGARVLRLALAAKESASLGSAVAP